jgi:hypothetical protein
MKHIAPGEIELTCLYQKHLGPRYEGAGLRIQFHYNQVPGIHFKVAPPEEYAEMILQGLKDGLSLRFPDFPSYGSIWILEIFDDPVDSSQRAFYKAARMIIDLACSSLETYEA